MTRMNNLRLAVGLAPRVATPAVHDITSPTVRSACPPLRWPPRHCPGPDGRSRPSSFSSASSITFPPLTAAVGTAACGFANKNHRQSPPNSSSPHGLAPWVNRSDTCRQPIISCRPLRGPHAHPRLAAGLAPRVVTPAVHDITSPTLSRNRPLPTGTVRDSDG
jgi:hypothetical protein